VVAIEHIHLHVSDQHAFVFPGFPFETNTEMFAEKAATSVCGDYVLSFDLPAEIAAHEGGGHRFLVLLDVDQFGCQLNLDSPFGEALAEDFFDAELGNDENAGVRNIGGWVAACVHIEVAEDGGAIVAAEGKVKASVGKDVVDDSQVVEEFETARLQSFSS
jgi:hypothetical protein